MQPKREIPFEWRIVMEQRGIRSLRDIAVRADLGHTTINRVVYNEGRKPSVHTMQKIADVLGMNLASIHELARRSQEHGKPWHPPEDSRFLTLKQRKAVEQIIRVMADGNRGEDEDPDDDS